VQSFVVFSFYCHVAFYYFLQFLTCTTEITITLFIVLQFTETFLFDKIYGIANQGLYACF